ncbi:MAG: citrate synthase [Chloroflexi bacterium]|nr:citrate synthase [Chloroflexota bacterium]
MSETTAHVAVEPAAKFSVDDRELTLRVEEGTEGERGVHIGNLLKDAHVTTIDYGFANTAVTRSAITFIDGDAGIVRYRGYPIEQLCERSNFLEVAYLLIFGELPTAEQCTAWTRELKRHTLLHEDLRRFFDAFPRDAHPMAVLASAVAALGTFYQDTEDPYDPDDVEISTIRLIAKVPTIIAFAYKRSVGQSPVYPNNQLEYVENFLRMMFAVPAEDYEVDPDVADILRQLLILHADHEQNCSTSTVRMVGSSRANLYASVSAGVSALWGPLHGGANQEVVEMLEQIAADGGNVRKYIDRAKDKNDHFRLMGFGHRVYRNYDPRARIIKQAAQRILAKLGADDHLLQTAMRLEEAALADEYFIERKLFPNLDFYSGIIYRALGFPTRMYPALFAMGRLPGWIAQWREMMSDPDTKIGRPRQIYIGHTKRDFAPMAERGDGRVVECGELESVPA